MIGRVAEHYQNQLQARGLIRSSLIAGGAFLLSVCANTLAGIYATERASNPVTDIILSNIPTFDVDAAFLYGAIILILFIALLLFVRPTRIPFTLYSLSIFFFTRAVFVSLTHLGLDPSHAPIDYQSKIILTFFGGGDEFFSGHTGVPFLMALIFWREVRLRYIFLVSTFVLAAIVLLGHFHYTIDVLSAFFITYGVYQIALWRFPDEHKLLLSSLT